jgi:DNA-binding MarR family transcriptional regulator
MNIQTPTASILSAFWRKGRQAFVPLTVRELIHQHGATAHAISTMVAAGLIRREEFSKDRKTAICTITEAGRRLVPQPIAAPKAKPAAKPAPAKPAKAPKPVQAIVQPYRVPDSLRHAYAGKPVSTSHIVAAMNSLAKHERRKGRLPDNKGAEAAEKGSLGGNRPETPATLAMKQRRRRMRALRAINGKALAASTIAVQAGFHKREADAACEWLVEQGHASAITANGVTRYTATIKGIEQLRREDERR